MNKSNSIYEPTRETVELAAATLQGGGLVAFPTETVYGLGADATNDLAVAAIYAAKGRPSFNPLIIHAPDAAALEKIVTFSETARRLAKRFWPGPLTMVLPRRPDCPVSLLAGAGLSTLAVRVPDHPVALRLLRTVALPIAAPSANASGRLSPTTAAHVAESLGKNVGIILDGGASTIGVESTVVDLTTSVPVVLRPGGISIEDLEQIAGQVERADSGAKAESGIATPKSPGMTDSHYAPRLPLRMDAISASADEGFLKFGADAAACGGAVVRNLSPEGNLLEAAANLFAMLHELDAIGGLSGIAVMPVPNTGIGMAINDRLRRAASA